MLKLFYYFRLLHIRILINKTFMRKTQFGNSKQSAGHAPYLQTYISYEISKIVNKLERSSEQMMCAALIMCRSSNFSCYFMLAFCLRNFFAHKRFMKRNEQ